MEAVSVAVETLVSCDDNCDLGDAVAAVSCGLGACGSAFAARCCSCSARRSTLLSLGFGGGITRFAGFSFFFLLGSCEGEDILNNQETVKVKCCDAR